MSLDLHIKHLQDYIQTVIQSSPYANLFQPERSDYPLTYEPGEAFLDRLVFQTPGDYHKVSEIRFGRDVTTYQEERKKREFEDGSTLRERKTVLPSEHQINIRSSSTLSYSISKTQTILDFWQGINDIARRIAMACHPYDHLIDRFLQRPEPPQPRQIDLYARQLEVGRDRDDLHESINQRNTLKEIKSDCRDRGIDISLSGRKGQVIGRLLDYAEENGDVERVHQHESWKGDKYRSIFEVNREDVNVPDNPLANIC